MRLDYYWEYNSAGTVMWKWENTKPYGNNLANETVSGSTFEYNLRFPGQYFDKETGLHYNYPKQLYRFSLTG